MESVRTERQEDHGKFVENHKSYSQFWTFEAKNGENLDFAINVIIINLPLHSNGTIPTVQEELGNGG